MMNYGMEWGAQCLDNPDCLLEMATCVISQGETVSETHTFLRVKLHILHLSASMMKDSVLIPKKL